MPAVIVIVRVIVASARRMIVARTVAFTPVMMSFGAAAFVAEVAVQRPRAALIGEEGVDDVIDRVEGGELVGELAVILAVHHLDLDGPAIEPERDAVVGRPAASQPEAALRDFDGHSAGAVAADAGVGRLGRRLSGCPALRTGHDVLQGHAGCCAAMVGDGARRQPDERSVRS